MIETKRLNMRKITQQDYDRLAVFLQNDEVMYAWNGGYNDEELQDFIDRNLKRYEDHGCGYFLTTEKQTGNTVGVMGLMHNDNIDGEAAYEVGYILDAPYWGKGYAQEGTLASIQFGFDQLDVDRVVAQMRTNNKPSERVAQALGLTYKGEYVRHYRGEDLVHKIYEIKKDEV